MTVDDLNAWLGQIDLAESLHECAEITKALGLSGKRYEDLLAVEAMLVDHVRDKEAKLRAVQFKAWESVGEARVNPHALRLFSPSYAVDPTINAAVQELASYPVKVA